MSLEKALTILGYRVTGPNGFNDPEIAENARKMVNELVPQYDAFQDNPWPLFYKEMDEQYPGSKFILTLRPTDEWLASAVHFFGAESTPMREWIYGAGSPLGNESTYTKRFETHNKTVLQYFKERPDDLLILRITAGDGWEKLCPFLDKEIPEVPFPHINKATNVSRRIIAVSFLKRVFGMKSNRKDS